MYFHESEGQVKIFPAQVQYHILHENYSVIRVLFYIPISIIIIILSVRFSTIVVHAHQSLHHFSLLSFLLCLFAQTC